MPARAPARDCVARVTALALTVAAPPVPRIAGSGVQPGTAGFVLISLPCGATPVGPCQLYVQPGAAVLLAFPTAGTAFSQRCRSRTRRRSSAWSCRHR